MRDTGAGEPRGVDVGRRVRMAGWVKAVRDMGGILFFDLRDSSGVVQVVDDLGRAPRLHPEDVVAIEGTLRRRPPGTSNEDLETGDVEVGLEQITMLSQSLAPPFPIEDRVDVAEELRLRFRYLDLRRPRMQRNLRLRSRVNSSLRLFLEGEGFVEVETPHLTASTPEGARDYLVPARNRPGSFYALPQSPQQFKQLLMVAGIERYYQIARCYRDEDLRGNRQPEFTQLDVEMSFVSEDDVMAVMEGTISAAVESVTGAPLQLPLPRMPYAEAMERYGTDKPDVRFGSEISDLGDVFAGTSFQAFAKAEAIRGICLPGRGAGASRTSLNAHVTRAQSLGARGLVYAIVEEDRSWRSPVAKLFSKEEQSAATRSLRAEPGDLLLLVADTPHLASRVLGQLRLELAAPRPGELPAGPWKAVWVVQFPAFRENETGGIDPESHPFTGLYDEELDLLETDPISMRARHYDLVMNGVELGSGSIRIHDRATQERVFRIIGIGAEQAEERFGHLLCAFDYGVPPHGGFALGLDRFVSVLAGEEAIREVIAFPKTQQGLDPLTGAPTPVEPAQLQELGIQVTKPSTAGLPRAPDPG
jgi:aspartyl-tRNA synthetase